MVVSYDVSTITAEGKKRLNKVSKACSGYGLRAQYSVFECDVDPGQWATLRARLLSIIRPDTDSLRFYFLGSNWQRRIERHGKQKAPLHGASFDV